MQIRCYKKASVCKIKQVTFRQHLMFLCNYLIRIILLNVLRFQKPLRTCQYDYGDDSATIVE